MLSIDVGTAQLACEIAGEGEPLVLVHGSWNQRASWGFFVPELTDQFRIVSYDRRGHGESVAQPDAGTVHDDVADLVTLIEELGIAPTHIIGNSFGASITLRLLSARPELVKRAIVHEPPLLNLLERTSATRAVAESERRKIKSVRDLLENGEPAAAAEHFVDNVAMGPGTWGLLPEPLRQVFVDNAQTFLGELRDEDALRIDDEALARISVPLLLTQGDTSPAFFAPIVDVIASVCTGAERHTVSGAGHVPQLTHPGDYANIVRDFLAPD
jgi:pimeloyl-ACP methyl ester carboxylesterase